MKMLITTRTRESFSALPEDKQTQLLQAAIAFAEKYKKSGECKALYTTGAIKGTVSIWDIAGDEVMTQRTFENPMSPYMDIEYQPIYEWHSVIKALGEFLKG